MKAVKAAKKTRRTRKQGFGDAAQGAILGGGFPLLFGGPSFSGRWTYRRWSWRRCVWAKSLICRWYCWISPFNSLDAAVEAAVELGKALEDPTRNAQQAN